MGQDERLRELRRQAHYDIGRDVIYGGRRCMVTARYYRHSTATIMYDLTEGPRTDAVFHRQIPQHQIEPVGYARQRH